MPEVQSIIGLTVRHVTRSAYYKQLAQPSPLSLSLSLSVCMARICQHGPIPPADRQLLSVIESTGNGIAFNRCTDGIAISRRSCMINHVYTQCPRVHKGLHLIMHRTVGYIGPL